MATQADDYARTLRIMDCLREKVIAKAFLELGAGKRSGILDAGCGIGSNLPLLAGLAGHNARITGLDISDEFISIARRDLAERGLAERISLVKGDIGSLPFSDGEFDCVVSVDCAGYPYSSNPAALIREMGRVIEPGGTMALMGWSHQQVLPGYSLLESKLNTASSITVYSGAGGSPETHFFAAPKWLEEGGFAGVEGRSYPGDIDAPLSDMQKEAVIALFDMLWSESRGALSDDEWRLYERITTPGTKDFILDRPDYYGFFIYTCFSGRVPNR